LDKVHAAYAKDIQAAYRENKSYDDIEAIRDTENWECHGIQEEIDTIASRALARKASRYRVPIVFEGWVTSQMHGTRYMTDDAYAALRRLIRIEKNERWDSRMRWMPTLTALITAIGGALGILIGLVSVLAHERAAKPETKQVSHLSAHP
jgi:hypothetical protein